MKSKKTIATLSSLIHHLNMTKLEFLKAADLQTHTEATRFFNQQARLRNRFCQELMAVLRSFDVSTENLLFNRTDLNQRIITTVDDKATIFAQKGMALDQELLVLYDQLVEEAPELELLAAHQKEITAALNTAKLLLSKTAKVQKQLLF